MKVLMIDVGGTNVKLMASGHEGFRKVPSGPTLTAAQMAKAVLKATKDWEYEAVTIGYPSLVADGKPAREPLNLGGGWLNFDYGKAFKKPVRFINDAAMQALASYEKGRTLFLGFGTSTGATIVVDHVIVPLEVGMLCLPDGKRFIDRLTDAVRQKRGRKKWLRSVYLAIEMLRDVFQPDDIILGGGNAKDIDPLPPGCRTQHNQGAFIGAIRLWPGADMLAEPYGTSWRIKEHKNPAKPKPVAAPRKKKPRSKPNKK
jgi:predicted NBD/HSP70 family sugar kinase